MKTHYRRQTARTEVARSNFIERMRRLMVAAILAALATIALNMLARAQADIESPEVVRAAFLPIVNFSAEMPCALNEQEEALLELMRQHPDQRREVLHCNAVLSEVARARAKDMAERRYFDHVNPDGHGPNYLVREAGFKLPDWYPDSESANNVESIAAHFITAADVWGAWLQAEAHRRHILGTDQFFAEQEEIGLGYYYDADSDFGEYWVLITAPTETD